MPAPLKSGLLRTIRAHLSKGSSPLEPVAVLLECGHRTQAQPTQKKARCHQCKRGARLSQARARLSQSRLRRAMVEEERVIYCTVEQYRGQKLLAGAGPRVLRVQVEDVTPTAQGRESRKGVRCMESLLVACEGGATLDYVRAQLLEMGAKLDGAVVVT